jgi:sugar phosphate isomerase/epimerase
MVTQTADVSGIDIVPVLKELGFDYAELSLTHLCAMDEAHFRSVKNELLGFGLPLEACNNFFPPTLPLTGSSAQIKAIKSYLEKAFARVSELGVKTIVFGSGGARTIPENLAHSDATEQLAQILRLINSFAVQHDITIAIEPLRKQECNIVNTYHEALVLANLADCSNVKCLLDIFHLKEEKENISVIKIKPEQLAHVHFAEPDGRIFPVETNRQVYKSIFQHIRQTGYNQRISIEAYSSDFRNDAAKALRLMKDIEEELNEKY